MVQDINGKIWNPESQRYLKINTAKGRYIIQKYYNKGNDPKPPNHIKPPSPPKPSAKAPSPPKPTAKPSAKAPSPPKPSFKKIKIVDINIKKPAPNPNNDVEPPKKTKFTITLAEFEKLVNTDDAFITKFKNAVVSLLEHKETVYSNTEYLPQPVKAVSGEPEIKPPYKLILEKIKNNKSTFKTGLGNSIIRNNLLSAINDKKNGMKSLIGREDLMDKIAGLLYAFSQNYRIFTKVFLNFAFFGSAGVGKSKIASVVGYVFKKSNILVDGNIVMATRNELVGQYIGHTSNKTRKLLLDSLEGVLFIDEAYSLTPCPEAEMGRDFGPEAVAELINFMDKTIGLSIIIVAGYKDKMTRCFFPFNEGLDRRFPYKFTLTNYSPENLTIMLLNNLEDNDIKVTEKTKNYLYSIICMLVEKYPEVVKNQAGDVLNFGNMLIQAIYMSFNIKWNNNETDNERIIVSALEDFLESKGLVLEF